MNSANPENDFPDIPRGYPLPPILEATQIGEGRASLHILKEQIDDITGKYYIDLSAVVLESIKNRERKIKGDDTIPVAKKRGLLGNGFFAEWGVPIQSFYGSYRLEFDYSDNDVYLQRLGLDLRTSHLTDSLVKLQFAMKNQKITTASINWYGKDKLLRLIEKNSGLGEFVEQYCDARDKNNFNGSPESTIIINVENNPLVSFRRQSVPSPNLEEGPGLDFLFAYNQGVQSFTRNEFFINTFACQFFNVSIDTILPTEQYVELLQSTLGFITGSSVR